jgi:hypothetical protein
MFMHQCGISNTPTSIFSKNINIFLLNILTYFDVFTLVFVVGLSTHVEDKSSPM